MVEKMIDVKPPVTKAVWQPEKLIDVKPPVVETAWQPGIIDVGYGRILWNLGVRTEYIPNSGLSCYLILVNPTDVDRKYKIVTRTIGSSGAILTESTILLNDQTWFILKSGQVVEAPGSIILGGTGCVLELGLHEWHLSMIVSSCYTYLYPPGTVWYV